MGIRAVANYTGKRSCHRMPGGGFDSAQELITSFNGPKVWYDLSNVATLQQDSAGTIPVAAPGDPIGRIMDISGANNHAVQATASNRPLWQTTFGAFDGVDDSWATPTIDFTSTNKITIIAGVRKLSDATTGIITELSININSNNGTFALFGPPGPGQTLYAMGGKGTIIDTRFASGFPAPISNVVTGFADISAPTVGIRVNGVLISSATNTLGTGTFGNYPLYIGRRGGTAVPFNGNLYGLIILGRLLSTAERAMLEQYMAAKVGIVI